MSYFRVTAPADIPVQDLDGPWGEDSCYGIDVPQRQRRTIPCTHLRSTTCQPSLDKHLNRMRHELYPVSDGYSCGQHHVWIDDNEFRQLTGLRTGTKILVHYCSIITPTVYYACSYGAVWSPRTLRASDLLLCIVKMANDDLTVGRLANMFSRAFYDIREQHKSGGPFNGVD